MTTRYVYNISDKSYFGLDDNVVLIDVPDDFEGEDLEEFFEEYQGDPIKVIDLIGDQNVS